MRATSMRRLVGAAAALTLVGSALLATAGAVTAGNTRILDIHSPTAPFGTLSFTEVGPGGVTRTDVIVSNLGKQNLSKAHLLIGAPFGADLPADVSVADVFGLQGAGTCAFTSSTVDCDFGALTSKGAGSTRTVSLAFNVGSVTSASAITVTIKVAENVSDVGSNQNFRQASGTPTVDAPSCDGYATYILSVHGDQTLAPSQSCAQDQISTLLLKANSGNGFAKFDDGTQAICTVNALTCFGNEVDATVHNGDTIDPYLTWVITYSANLMHSINPKMVAFQHGSDTPLTLKKNTCGTTFTKDCIVGYTVDPVTGAVTFEIRTATNSTIRGLH